MDIEIIYANQAALQKIQRTIESFSVETLVCLLEIDSYLRSIQLNHCFSNN